MVVLGWNAFAARGWGGGFGVGVYSGGVLDQDTRVLSRHASCFHVFMFTFDSINLVCVLCVEGGVFFSLLPNRIG